MPPAVLEVDEIELFKLFHGGRSEPLRLGVIPHDVQEMLGWACGGVYLSSATAQKLRFGKNLAYSVLQSVPHAICFGRIARDHEDEKAVRFIDKISHVSSSYLYVVARIDKNSTGVFIRTFFKRRDLTRKVRNGEILRFGLFETTRAA